jgi:Fe-S cluster assembly iron-binding protein IscA
MIGVTERASHELKQILTANHTPKDRAVKIVPGESGGLAMVIDRPREGDAVVEGEERPLLIVDASITERLDNVVLDASSAATEEAGPRFVLRNPER